MKKITAVLFFVFAFVTVSMAQPGNQTWERIHAFKMAYVTDRLHLLPEQSGNFVPLYNEYEGEARRIRHSFFKKYNITNGDHRDRAARQAVDDDLDYQQQIIDLKRRYNDRFLKVISPQQLADLYKAEREFRQILIRQLYQQHHNGGGGRFR